MNNYYVVCLLAVSACAQNVPGLQGTVTDPSGAAVPGAVVEVRGPGGEHRAATNSSGQYTYSGRWRRAAIRFESRRRVFALSSKEIAIEAPVVFDAQLVIQTETQVVNVEDQSGGVSAEAESNGGALVLGARELAVLSDDPDELALQLQTLAGPAPGPDGGQMFVDGFSGGSLPPKSAIREIRINSNPFSPEYDHPGFARIDVFTKPGQRHDSGPGVWAVQRRDSEFAESATDAARAAALPDAILWAQFRRPDQEEQGFVYVRFRTSPDRRERIYSRDHTG